jgi:hypothetical protein
MYLILLPKSPNQNQKIANAFGGHATPPRTFSGSLVKKNVHRFEDAQYSASRSRSNSSPISMPKPARRIGCRKNPLGAGIDC